jgi:polyisoprenoid-binding protein YceI
MRRPLVPIPPLAGGALPAISHAGSSRGAADGPGSKAREGWTTEAYSKYVEEGRPSATPETGPYPAPQQRRCEKWRLALLAAPALLGALGAGPSTAPPAPAPAASAAPAPAAVQTAAADPYDAYYGSLLRVDDTHSLVSFAVQFLGLTRVEGRFKDFRGTLYFGPGDVTRSSISVSIRAQSLDTANELRDKDLRSDAFFDVEKYPEISFTSTRIERRPGGLTAVGELFLHGVTRRMAIPFTLVAEPAKDPWGNVRCAFEGSLTFNRGDFGVGGYGRFGDIGKRAIGDEVTVRLAIQAVRWDFETFTIDKRSIAAALQPVLAEQGPAAAVASYRALERDHPGDYDFTERQLSVLGYLLLQRRKLAEAIAIFGLNAEVYAKSSTRHSDLALVLAAAGQRGPALASCNTALGLDPRNTDALELKRRLEAAPRAGAR